MSVDYRPRARKKNWPLIVAIVAVLGAAAAGGEIWFLKTEAAKEKADEVVGPPCAALTAEAFAARHLTAKMKADYEGINFARAAGHISCDLKKGAQICQFTSPIVVVVTPPSGPASYFEPGVGRPATVTVKGGQASCVMASNFRV